MIPAWRPTLRLRLTAAFSGVALLATLGTGYFSIRRSYDALKLQKQQDEAVMAENIAAQVDDTLRKAKRSVVGLAAHSAVVAMDVRRRREALTLATDTMELIDGLLVLDADGRILAYDQAEPDTRRLFPVSPYRQFVADVRRSRSARYSGVYRTVTGELAVAILAPILRGEALVGVLAGGILLQRHTVGGIEEIRIGRSGFAYIVDAEGNVIVHPQKERLLESARENPAVRELLERRRGTIEFVNQEGVSVLAAFAPIRETGWGVVVRQPTSESYAFAEELLAALTVTLLLGLAASAAAGAAVARRISEPVTTLLGGVRQLALGRLDVRVPVPGRDEIGELASAFNEMAGRLERRTRESVQAQKMAAIGQLAAGLAHEINNPLSVISGFNELLLKRTPPEDPRHAHLEEVARETARCQRLVRDLLAFAKPKEPERTLQPVNPLVRETVELLRSQAGSAGVSLEPDLDPGEPTAALDRDQVKQVLLNLVLNACQAMPKGGRVRVATRLEAEGVRIEVADEGAGVAPEHLPKLFTPFFTTRPEGTGLGLASSYAIVQGHGGSLSVESAPGAGAVFTVRLPAEGDHA